MKSQSELRLSESHITTTKIIILKYHYSFGINNFRSDNSSCYWALTLKMEWDYDDGWCDAFWAMVHEIKGFKKLPFSSSTNR